MRLLLDSCMWGPAVVALRQAGHDATWTGDWPADPGDEVILQAACDDNRVLVTLDRDFGELAIRHGRPHCGIIRIVNFSARQQANVCLAVLAAHGDDLTAGAIVTAEPGRMRIRPASP